MSSSLITLLCVACVQEPQRPELEGEELGGAQAQAGSMAPSAGEREAALGEREAALDIGVSAGDEGMSAGEGGGEPSAGSSIRPSGGALAGGEAGGEASGEAGGEPQAGLPLPPALELPPPTRSDERCDGLDNDLDGQVDELVSNPCGGCQLLSDEEALSCQSWLAQAIHSYAEGAPDALDPARLVSPAGLVSSEARFELEGSAESDPARCRVSRARLTPPPPDLGLVSLESPWLNLRLSYDAATGRYSPIGGAELLEPSLVHRPGDELRLGWEGHPELMTWGRFEPGELSLRSPPALSPLDPELLRPVLERFAGRRPLSEPVTLRWVPEGLSAAPSALPAQELSLYVGGSRSIVRRGPYREIQHFQLGLTLADDGLYELPASLSASRPGSGLWVYLERSERAWAGEGLHAVSARVGHRVELRETGSGGLEGWQSPVRLIAPSEELSSLERGAPLAVEWERVGGEAPLEGFAISLVTRDQTELRSLLCELEPSARRLLIPAELLTPWPQGAGGLRLLTLRAQLKSASIEGADRGRFSEGLSLILELPEAE